MPATALGRPSAIIGARSVEAAWRTAVGRGRRGTSERVRRSGWLRAAATSMARLRLAARATGVLPVLRVVREAGAAALREGGVAGDSAAAVGTDAAVRWTLAPEAGGAAFDVVTRAAARSVARGCLPAGRVTEVVDCPGPVAGRLTRPKSITDGVLAAVRAVRAVETAGAEGALAERLTEGVDDAPGVGRADSDDAAGVEAAVRATRVVEVAGAVVRSLERMTRGDCVGRERGAGAASTSGSGAAGASGMMASGDDSHNERALPVRTLRGTATGRVLPGTTAPDSKRRSTPAT